MTVFPLKSCALSLIAGISLLLALWPSPAAATESWTSVHSRHFLLIGTAGEREMRLVAARLEQFRAVLKQLPLADRFETRKRTMLIIFGSPSDYRPFAPFRAGRPLNRVAGHFQPGLEMDYIALAVDEQAAKSTD